MAKYLTEPSRTFSEFLLIPGYSDASCIVENVSLKTPLVRFKKGEIPSLSLNIPMTSAIMQSVSNDTLAIALSKQGGVSFIFGSQSIEDQANMVRKVKDYKAGFVKSDSNLSKDSTIHDLIQLKSDNNHSTIAITEDGSLNSKFLGIITSRDIRIDKIDLNTKVIDIMTGVDKLITANVGITLSNANDIIWNNKINQLPILDEKGRLNSFVFRKDYTHHKENPNELSDSQKRLIVGAGINTRDYKERVPALIEAGVDVLCIDSSEGYSQYQKDTIAYIKETFGDNVKVGAGNVVDGEGFRFLADAGADFVKIGIGGGSICITREQKGIGRGQASAVIDVANERDVYFKETGIYIPLCSDGGIVYDYHMTLALAMGADFLMLGRYFARFDESPTRKLNLNGNFVKEYWGEGSARARNWQRYDLGQKEGMKFEEGVDSFVPYAGSLNDNLNVTLTKIKSTMCNCGAKSIKELQEKAKITLVSATSLVEGGAHDVIIKDKEI